MVRRYIAAKVAVALLAYCRFAPSSACAQTSKNQKVALPTARTGK